MTFVRFDDTSIMTDEELDARTLAAIRSLKPGWLPPDDEFAPTISWDDCGPLIGMFKVDLGPDTRGWGAYCEIDPGYLVYEHTPQRAICAAVCFWAEYGSKRK